MQKKMFQAICLKPFLLANQKLNFPHFTSNSKSFFNKLCIVNEYAEFHFSASKYTEFLSNKPSVYRKNYEHQKTTEDFKFF